MTRRAAVLAQPGLFDLDPKPEPRTVSREERVRRPTHEPRPRRSKEAQADECAPACLTCRKPEGRGLCVPRCAVVCTHANQPSTTEVCLVQVHVTAVLVTGTPTLYGARHLALVCCPHCGQVHWHAATYGARYRVSACGLPYIVHLPRPRPGGVL